MTARDIALEMYAHWCAAGLSTAQLMEALTVNPETGVYEPWLFPDAPPAPSYVVDSLADAWRSLPIVTLDRGAA